LRRNREGLRLRWGTFLETLQALREQIHRKAEGIREARKKRVSLLESIGPA